MAIEGSLSKSKQVIDQQEIQQKSSSCSYKMALISGVASAVILAAASFACKAGGLGQIVCWSISGSSALFVLTVGMSSFVLRKKEEPIEGVTSPAEGNHLSSSSEKGESASLSSLGDLPPSDKRKFWIARHAPPLTLEDLERRYVEKPSSQRLNGSLHDVPTAKEDAGGRLSYHLLMGLLNPLFETCSFSVLASPSIEKINQLTYFLSLESNALYKFIISEKDAKNELQKGLAQALKNVWAVASSPVSLASLRYKFLQDLGYCASHEDYWKNLEAYYSMEEKVALCKFPEIAILQALIFEIFAENSLTHFFSEMASIPPKLLLEENFTTIVWRGCYKNDNETITPSFNYIGSSFPLFNSLNEESPLLKLFIDYCKKEHLQCAFFPGIRPPSKNSGWGENLLSLDFPTDSSFFEQSGIYREKKWEESEYFIHAFCTRIKEEIFGLSFEEEELLRLINEVHLTFFQNKPKLNREERKIFQVFFYAVLIEQICLRFKVDFFFFRGGKESTHTIMTTLLALSLVRQNDVRSSLEEKLLGVLSKYPSYFLTDAKNLHLLRIALKQLFSQEEKVRKSLFDHGISAGGGIYSQFETILINQPNQTFERIPSEARGESEYIQLLKKEKSLSFQLYFFVQSFFARHSTFLIDNLSQFFENDFHRLQYLIENSKICLPNFEKTLRDEFLKKEKVLDERAKIFDSLIGSILLMEEATEDPIVFVQKASHLCQNSSELFECVKKVYFNERAKAVEELSREWAKCQDASYQKKYADKILALSHQGILTMVSSFLQERYRFAAGGSKEIQFSERDILVYQRKPKDRANTCFNYKTWDKTHYIEVLQIYEIAQGFEKEVLSYLVTNTEINLETGHATIYCGAPLKKDPGDISKIIQNKKTFMR